jgi:two-component system OmpR family response regulator
MPTRRTAAQPILGFVYTVTDKGHYLLLRAGAELPQLEQELLVRIDGRTTRDQLVQDTRHATAYELASTLAGLLERGLIEESDVRLPEDTSLDFTGELKSPVALPALDKERGNAIRIEAVRGAGVLEQQGYYLSIARRAALKRAPRNGKGYSVLVIEDEPTTAKLLKLLLASEGFEVGVARNREEILLSLSLEPLPDVVLLDVLLPDVNGFNLLSKMRGHSTYREIPVVMLTARAGRDDVQQGLALGADGYITKPFDLDRVVNAVHDVLGN